MSGINFAIVDKYNLWWDVKKPDQLSLFESQVRLGERFFNEVIENPVPIDIRVLKALKKSPMALDIYCWMTYKMSYLKKKTDVPWAALQAQFGANYALDSQGTRNFKRAFLRRLSHVYGFYHGFGIHHSDKGLTLSPGKPHINKLAKLAEGKSFLVK